MPESPYMPGYEAWETFDAMPKAILDAHKTVYTGIVAYPNQFEKRLILSRLDESTAAAILDLDGGKQMLGAVDLCGDPQFS